MGDIARVNLPIDSYYGCLTAAIYGCTPSACMDMMGTSASEQVVQTVANQSDTDAVDLPPLFDALDPDSLDTLIREMDEGMVSFDYAGYDITVNTNGAVEVDAQPSTGNSANGAADDD